MHCLWNIPPTLLPLTWKWLGSKSLPRLQWGDSQSRMMLCLDHHANQNAANGSAFIFMLARSQLQSSFRYAFRCSSEASTPRTHMKRTYRCAQVCDARCQFWRPQAPTLASYHAAAGLAEDVRLERLPGKRQPKPNKFSSNDREKQRNKQEAKKKKNVTVDNFFYRLRFLGGKKSRKTIAAGRVIYS